MKPLIATLLIVVGLPPAIADQPTDCKGYRGDVSHELDLLGQPAASLNAGRDTKTIAHVDIDKHYAVKLVPQSSLKLAAKVDKAAADPAAHGGLLAFRTGEAGRYRVSLSTAHWIDVVDAGNLVVSLDFQGQRDCAKLRKVVELELTGKREFVLQLSGATDESVGLAITRAPPFPPAE